MPGFLSGEKRQAICTSTFISPEKRVGKINGECNRTQLQNYLYALSYPHNTTKLTLPRSKYYISLSQDLDDNAVSLLIENGLSGRFSTACNAWKFRNAESKEATQRSISEEKLHIDEQLKGNLPLLEDTLTKEITRRILEIHGYVPFVFEKQGFNMYLVHLTQKCFPPLRLRRWMLRILLQVWYSSSYFSKSNDWYQTPQALGTSLKLTQSFRKNLTLLYKKH